MKSMAFSAEHKRGWQVVRGLRVEFAAALVHAVNPETGALELLQALRYVADADYGKVLQRARGRLGHGFGEAGGAPLRNQDGRCARGMRGPDDGAKIVRIFHAIQKHQQLRAGKNVVKVRVVAGGAKCNHALMGHTAAGAIQSVARLKSYGYVTIAAKIDDLLEARPACAAGDQHAVDRALRLERFAHRMNTGDSLGGASRILSVVAIC